jgi:hypothetical protein
MKQKREDKISAILGEIKPQAEKTGLSPDLWIVIQEEDVNHPRFEECYKQCQKILDNYYLENGEHDTKSAFAEFVNKFRYHFI